MFWLFSRIRSGNTWMEEGEAAPLEMKCSSGQSPPTTVFLKHRLRV